MEQNVTIILNTIDIEKFKLFQKYYVLFNLLDSVDTFSIKNGSITLDFDSLGQIRSVRKEATFRPAKDEGIKNLTEIPIRV